MPSYQTSVRSIAVLSVVAALVFVGAVTSARTSFGAQSGEPAATQMVPASRLASAERLGLRNLFGPQPATPSNFDVAQYLRPGNGIPESSAWEPTGNFRITCEFSHFAYDDPIINPGQPGASHLHMFFGNRSTNAMSTYESLRAAGDSSCPGGPINRTGYWAPAVLDQAGQAVTPEYISVYYKGRGRDVNGNWVDVAPLPPGLRMVAGASPADPGAPSNHEWYCESTQNKSRSIPSCPTGELVGVQLAFPQCWNGRDLDSSDHRSHMAYIEYAPDTGKPRCPQTHPVPLAQFTLGIWFQHAGDSASWYLASDRMPGMPQHSNGSSFHSDWFGAWDPDVQQTWTDRCINGLLNCSGNELGDGTELVPEVPYTGPQRVPVPPRPVGLRSAPVQGGPSTSPTSSTPAGQSGTVASTYCTL